MTQEVFHKLITLTFGLDMESESERTTMIQQLGSLVLRSVALRAIQSVPTDKEIITMEQFSATTDNEQFLRLFTESFPDIDIWIQEEVRKLHEDFVSQ